jgi:hypothetical protein
MMANTYQGPVRIFGSDGILLTTGIVTLETDSEQGSWKGALQTLRGTGVAGKALVVNIEIPEGNRGLAQLTPMGEAGDRATAAVSGLGARPF